MPTHSATCGLTIVDSFSALSTVSVEETDSADDAAQFAKLLLFVFTGEGDEHSEFRLWEDTL